MFDFPHIHQKSSKGILSCLSIILGQRESIVCVLFLKLCFMIWFPLNKWFQVKPTQNKIGFFVFTKVDPHDMKRLKGYDFMYVQTEIHWYWIQRNTEILMCQCMLDTYENLKSSQN